MRIHLHSSGEFIYDKWGEKRAFEITPKGIDIAVSILPYVWSSPIIISVTGTGYSGKGSINTFLLGAEAKMYKFTEIRSKENRNT